MQIIYNYEADGAHQVVENTKYGQGFVWKSFNVNVEEILRFNCNYILKYVFITFSGDEIFSDTYKIVLKDDVLYEVYGKLVQRAEGNIEIAGFNPSAEEADEGTEQNVESGVDIVLNHRLCETYAFGDKKSFTLYLKDYMKK